MLPPVTRKDSGSATIHPNQNNAPYTGMSVDFLSGNLIGDTDFIATVDNTNSLTGAVAPTMTSHRSRPFRRPVQNARSMGPGLLTIPGASSSPA